MVFLAQESCEIVNGAKKESMIIFSYYIRFGATLGDNRATRGHFVRLWSFIREEVSTAVYVSVRLVDSRFNKICHPSQRPRWQVDKEAIGLSRVQQCSPTYNPPS